MAKTVLVAGASGLVGSASVQHFAAEEGTRVIALSRRKPSAPAGVELATVDLTDAPATAVFARSLKDVTHLVYAALYEKPQLLAGWVDREQIATNAAMFRNLLGPLADRGGLRHVAILQGTKAYGIHVRQIPIPAREDRDEAYDIASDTWEAYAPMMTPRHGLGAVAIDDTIYVAGGGPVMGGGIQSAINEAFVLG